MLCYVMYVCMYVCMNLCMYVYMYVCMYVCIYIYIYIYLCNTTRASSRSTALSTLLGRGCREQGTVTKFNHGNWLVTIGRSPLLWHGYDQTNIRHQALNKHLMILFSDIQHIITISYS